MLLSREGLERIGRVEIAHLGHVGMPVEGVVVDRELRVERLHLPVRRHDERVDLAEHRVEADERVVELADDRRDLLLLRGVGHARAVDEPPRLPWVEALERVDVKLDESVGTLLGDLLDVDPALGREHVERLLRATVEGQRQVVLLRDLRRLLDPEPADDVATDVEPENLAGTRLGLVRARGELDPARLAPPAREDLRLDDDRPTELLGRGARLLGRGREPPLRDRDPGLSEELLALVLVEVHEGRRLAAEPPARSPRVIRQKPNHPA